MKKALIQIKISHKDPKIQKRGEKAVKNLLKAIGMLFGEDIKFYKTKKEALNAKKTI